MKLSCALLLFLAGCGAPPPAKPAAEPAVEPGPASATEHCLARAATERQPPPDAPARVSLKHVLVKHAEADRAEDATRSRGEACLRAEEALAKLKQGTSWDEVVAAYSDEAGASTRGGTLGEVDASQLDPAFAAAAFSLSIDQASEVVESKFGFHLILRVH